MHILWIVFIGLSIIVTLFVLCIIFERVSKDNFHMKLYPEYYKTPYFEVNMPAEHREMVEHGYKKALESRIVFAGLCRNNENRIKKNIDMCCEIAKYFKDYRVVLFENDSSDKTREIVKEYSTKNNKVILLECTGENKECKFNLPEMYSYGTFNLKRIDKMAFFRNQYMNYIKQNLQDYDYVLMADFDIEGYTNIDGVMHALGKSKKDEKTGKRVTEDWDAIAVNGRMGVPGTFGLVTVMYDTLAYAKTEEDMEKCRTSNYTLFKGVKDWLDPWKLDDKDFTPVSSAFNSMCLYKMRSVLTCEYPYGYCCEHIGFHAEMTAKGYNKIYIDPYWISYVGNQGPSGMAVFGF